jgi:hypothetical protein
VIKYNYSKEEREKEMKKIVFLFVLLFSAAALAGCASNPLENTEKAYYATGQWGGWGEGIGQEANKMTPIALNDARVASVKDQLKGATALYIFEWVIPTTEAGWTVTYKINGVDKTVDGNFALKVVRTAVDDADLIDWWGQSPESGKLNNLTPSTLYVPPFVEENVDQAGGWNDNPIALTAGTYYIVYAEVGTVKYLGLIAK